LPSSSEYPDTSGQYPTDDAQHLTTQATSTADEQRVLPLASLDDAIDYVPEEGEGASSISIVTPCLDSGTVLGAGTTTKNRKRMRGQASTPVASSMEASSLGKAVVKRGQKKDDNAAPSEKAVALLGLSSYASSSSDDE